QLLPVALAAVVSVLVGLALVAKPSLVLLLVLGILGVLGIGVALTHPGIAFVGLIGILAFLPTYAGPSMGPLLLIPSAVASWAVAVALGWRNIIRDGRVLRINRIDASVGLFALLMFISISFSPRTSRSEWIHVMFLWLGPYLGVRLLLNEVRDPLRILAFAFGIATTILAPIALLEHLGGSNIFHNLDFNGTEYAVWAEEHARFGATRAAASWGHPIALSMFAAASSLFTLAAALNTGNRRERNLWYAATVISLTMQVSTVSRTGWLMLFVGLLGIVFVFATGVRRRRLLGIIATLGVLVIGLLVVAPSALNAVPGFEKGDAQSASSSRYRAALIDRALEPGVLNAWGNAQDQVTPFVVGSTATDNAYIILADLWGLIPTAALLLLALALLSVAIAGYRRDPTGLVAFPIVAFACMAGLFVVAFITQQQAMIWMIVGAAGVTAERFSSRSRPADLAAPPAPQPVVARDRM
ncbi:MAG TPA: O-antigen ligase family protein, partial [Solirubrobacterales bacterium]|nr:O-antigen ligase family protein [Solirubrobacterales bacterium]